LLYRNWIEDVVAGPYAYAISPQVLASVIRIATHPRIHARPSRLSDVMAFANSIIAPAHCQLVQPGPRHWEIFTVLCDHASASGNLVQDAWLAALAIETGCEWITIDKDFARFPGLRWRPPF
jgi:toxin-antitoxin system PIN domain toxin